MPSQVEMDVLSAALSDELGTVPDGNAFFEAHTCVWTEWGGNSSAATAAAAPQEYGSGWAHPDAGSGGDDWGGGAPCILTSPPLSIKAPATVTALVMHPPSAPPAARTA
eukprot:1249537-Prymnesium_polylepis.1